KHRERCPLAHHVLRCNVRLALGGFPQTKGVAVDDGNVASRPNVGDRCPHAAISAYSAPFVEQDAARRQELAVGFDAECYRHQIAGYGFSALGADGSDGAELIRIRLYHLFADVDLDSGASEARHQQVRAHVIQNVAHQPWLTFQQVDFHAALVEPVRPFEAGRAAAEHHRRSHTLRGQELDDLAHVDDGAHGVDAPEVGAWKIRCTRARAARHEQGVVRNWLGSTRLPDL